MTSNGLWNYTSKEAWGFFCVFRKHINLCNFIDNYKSDFLQKKITINYLKQKEVFQGANIHHSLIFIYAESIT